MDTKGKLKELFEAGAHYAYSKRRRHPSAKAFIFGAKNTTEIFDLEKTQENLARLMEFVASLGKDKKQVLFVSSKPIAREVVSSAATKLKMPYVTGRWIGGTLTNMTQVKKRIERLEDLRDKKEKKELDKYTKHERLLIDREIEELTERFGGLVGMKDKPAALVVIDPREEDIAVAEAVKLGIPVVAIANSDCDLNSIDYVFPGNDANIKTITFFVNRVVESYQGGVTK